MQCRLVVLLFVSMMATACSGTSADGVTANQNLVDSSTDTTTAATEEQSDTSESTQNADAVDTASEPAGGAVEQGATAMAASSPIGAFFSDGGGFEAAIAEYRRQVNEAILVCMAAQGFEFAATEANTRNEVQDRQNDLTVREWTSEYGFGISTSFDSVAQNQAANPNVAIFISLSPAEQEIWALTLNGVGTEALGGGGGPVDNSRPLEEQGCIGQALIETGGQEAIEGLGDFGDIYDEGEEALFERREMVEVITAWSRCMSESGFAQFASLDDPENEVRERFQRVTAPIGDALDALSDEEGQALISGESLDLEKLPGLDVDALREVQAYELELAVADLDCYEAEVQAVYEPLRDEFENGLLEEYATELTAVKDLGQ